MCTPSSSIRILLLLSCILACDSASVISSLLKSVVKNHQSLRLYLRHQPAPGATIAAVGESSEFGTGDISRAPKLAVDGKTGLYAVTVSLPATLRDVQYSYVEVGKDGVCTHLSEMMLAQGALKRTVALPGVAGESTVVLDSGMLLAKHMVLGTSLLRTLSPATPYSNLQDMTCDVKDGNLQLSLPPGMAAQNRYLHLTDDNNLQVRVTIARRRFQVWAPGLREGDTICIKGEGQTLGVWDASECVAASCVDTATWCAQVAFPKAQKQVQYKLCVTRAGGQTVYEEPQAREVSLPEDACSTLVLRDLLNFPQEFRCAGVAVPVSALRTMESMGVGEFLDIPQMVDLTVRMGMQVLQILPVNDSGDEPSPYSAISAFALHPIHIRLSSVIQYYKDLAASINLDEELAAVREAVTELNAAAKLQYNTVLARKESQFSGIIRKVTVEFAKQDEAFIQFASSNQHWLKTYTAYRILRDQKRNNPTSDDWWDTTKWTEKAADAEKIMADSDEASLTMLMQYHLHLQLSQASSYARSARVALKGDLPFGVTRGSADVWALRSEFRITEKCGAPSLDPRHKAQVWGFPPYNWEAMKNNDFQWWRARIQRWGLYFDALRLDHVLGFFRAWVVPEHDLTGNLGYYRPSRGITTDEMKKLVSKAGSLSRLEQPWADERLLQDKFGAHFDWATEQYFDKRPDGVYSFRDWTKNKAGYPDQVKLNADVWLNGKGELSSVLQELASNVLFVKDGDKSNVYHPTCHARSTASFHALTEEAKQEMSSLWEPYYFPSTPSTPTSSASATDSHLSKLCRTSPVLMCGEDLGDVPAYVPPLLQSMGVLSLRILRWSGELPHEYPYLSVASPSCHDCSTVRLWWEEDRGGAQRVHNKIFWEGGNAPPTASESVNKRLIEAHAKSSSLMSIIPLQDVLDCVPSLRSRNMLDDQINRPGSSDGCWTYRMEHFVEDLVDNKELCESVCTMMQECKRGVLY